MFLDVSEGVTVAANKLPMGAFEILISPIVNIYSRVMSAIENTKNYNYNPIGHPPST